MCLPMPPSWLEAPQPLILKLICSDSLSLWCELLWQETCEIQWCSLLHLLNLLVFGYHLCWFSGYIWVLIVVVLFFDGSFPPAG